MRSFGGKVRRKDILVGRPRSRWEDNDKIDPREVGWDGMGLYGLNLYGRGVQWWALVNKVMNLRLP
jgi:hypothetical protein